MSHPTHRTVHDSLGALQIPANAYYGAQTARAIANFPISALRLPNSFIRAQAIVKWAAAKAHKDLGVLPPDKADAICAAAEEVIAGRHSEWFQVDVYQAGAGTSQNMNVNEVIASRACELLGGPRGDTGLVHPNDDVNKSQSTNDTIHIAMNIAGMEMLAHELEPALAALQQALESKRDAFAGVVKAGRTHLQDAVPLFLGDEFGAYAENIRRHRIWLEQGASNLLAIGMGGNAVGTGINTPVGFAARATAYIAEYTELAFHRPVNPFTFNQNPDEIVLVSGVLRNIAQALARLANDLRLLASGPRTGFSEIILPAVQPGSSIMPGKVNPVLPEMLNMVALQVIGCDTTVAQAGVAGQLELNVMMPVMAANFLHSIHILSTGVRTFTEGCIRGIEADAARCLWYAENTLSLATAMNVELGYEEAANVVKYALANNLSLRDAGLALGVDAALLTRALDVHRLARVADDLVSRPQAQTVPSAPTPPADDATKQRTGAPFEAAD
ncbi:aspartate ammonia-lyase [Alicyclobacillus fastidiosus]|uniref:Aspartate ammonia-lyase n=1 Tax=Alicyclobacillus fastidiosus TaxID=392011 RepID=A0ABY6ZD44_9BACL|nr:aspartate ammonia-lyase [Alicyclobacillus fastidiosus]WAH40823.1 aspartate ammonia-lyase [Alicyclobacillus fastidiosus]GMA62306.1 aspartate ammonia-lyase [Alicyclobacillus fastidiosus]